MIVDSRLYIEVDNYNDNIKIAILTNNSYITRQTILHRNGYIDHRKHYIDTMRVTTCVFKSKKMKRLKIK